MRAEETDGTGAPVLYDLLIGPFAEFDFMRRALVGVVALSVSGAPIGVFLMLRGMSLAGDAMAHAILPGAGPIHRQRPGRQRLHPAGQRDR